jgi:hypothetical protein
MPPNKHALVNMPLSQVRRWMSGTTHLVLVRVLRRPLSTPSCRLIACPDLRRSCAGGPRQVSVPAFSASTNPSFAHRALAPRPPASWGSKEKHYATYKRCSTGDDRNRLPFNMTERSKRPHMQ